MIVLNQLTQVNLFRAWGNRPFALLWSGQALSRIGDYLYEVALAWWVLQESGSAGAMAAVLIFTLSPTMLFSLFGGVIVDRYPRLPLLREEIRPLPADGPQSILADFQEGLRTVWQMPWLWLTIGLFAICNVTLAGPYSVSMPFLVDEVLHADVELLGLLYSMFAVGYVLGGIWLGRKPAVRRRGFLIYGGSTLAGTMLLLFGLPVGIPVLIIAALINGAALELGMLAWTSALQELVPREKLGRVAGVDTVGSLALLPIDLGLAGLATEAWGPAAIFVIGGGVTAVLSLIAYQHPAVKKLD